MYLSSVRPPSGVMRKVIQQQYAKYIHDENEPYGESISKLNHSQIKILPSHHAVAAAKSAYNDCYQNLPRATDKRPGRTAPLKATTNLQSDRPPKRHRRFYTASSTHAPSYPIMEQMKALNALEVSLKTPSLPKRKCTDIHV